MPLPLKERHLCIKYASRKIIITVAEEKQFKQNGSKQTGEKKESRYFAVFPSK